MVEMPAKPAGRARRSDGPGQPGRKRADEIDRADHRANAFAKRAHALRLAALVELGRKRAADPLLDRGDELRAGEPDIMLDRVLDAGAVAKVGQQFGKQAIALELAFEKHAVEVEDDRAELQHQSSNKAVPTRTAVAPSMTAARNRRTFQCSSR